MKATTDPNKSVILGPNGQPFDLIRHGTKRSIVTKSTMHPVFNDLSSWFASLARTGFGGVIRARDPFGNHPWVFAAAMVTAIVAAQAPYVISHETEDLIDKRKKQTKALGRQWRGGCRGNFRRAIQRHLHKPLLQRLMSKGLEADYDHPVMNVLVHPNPLQSASQLWQLTHLWMALRGEVFWVGEMEDGTSVLPGALPERIWCLSPDLFEPIYENGSHGELIGWYFCPPIFMRKRLAGVRLPLPLTDIVQFKMPNPMNPIRGLSPISAVAMNIQLDMLAKDYNRSILENGGDPGGIITYDSDLTKDEETEYMEKWEQIHKGAANARRTGLLSGGFKYQPVALSPQDLQFLEMMKWDREETLAAMGVPPSILGATQFTNYATALAQDKTFWDKKIIPLLRTEEDTVDGTLLFNEPDTVVGAFDLKNIEALRTGVDDKINMANSLAGGSLHVPPAIAYEVVGLEVPEYLGDHSAILPPISTPARDIFLPPSGAMPTTMPNEDEPSDDPTPDGEEGSTEFEDLFRFALGRNKDRIVQLKASRWNQFVQVQEPIEVNFKGRYSQWIKGEKTLMLDWFDDQTKSRKLRLLMEVIERVGNELLATLPDIKEGKDRLKGKIRPIYSSALEETYKFTLSDVGGVPIFDIDDPRILEFFDKRERAFVNATPETVRKNMIKSLQQGLAEGESVQQLRFRIAQVFDISASSAKALSIARTESGSFMNGVRDVMFEASGFTEELWSTALDEHVRDSHVLYGEEDAMPRTFNFLEVSGKTGAGILTHPGDVRCSDLSEIINCRCLKIPVK